MPLNTFIDPQEVRDALGVGAEAYPDDVVLSGVFIDELTGDLESLNPIVMDTLTSGQEDPQRASIVRTARVYCVYKIASLLARTVQLRAHRSESDTKSRFDRFNDPLAGIKEDMDAAMGRAYQRLVSAVNDYLSSQITLRPRTLLTLSRPDYDPVTGEGA